MKKYMLDEMTWKEAEEAFQRTDIAILPLGCTHAHGLAVPLGADHILALEVSRRIAEKCDVIVAPTVQFGYAGHHIDFPGTISISNCILKDLIMQVCKCLHKWGIRKIIFNTGHGAWREILGEIAQDLRSDCGILSAQFDWYSQIMLEGFEWYKFGAGEGMIQEISGMLAVRPDIVRLDALEEWKGYRSPLGDTLPLISTSYVKFGKSRVRIYLRNKEVTEDGHVGGLETRDYSKASTELGEHMINDVVDYMVKFIEEFRRVRIPPLPSSKPK
jgi:creatinine amidohydrolase